MKPDVRIEPLSLVTNRLVSRPFAIVQFETHEQRGSTTSFCLNRQKTDAEKQFAEDRSN